MGDFGDKLLGQAKMNVVTIVVKICMMIVHLLNEHNFEMIASIMHYFRIVK